MSKPDGSDVIAIARSYPDGGGWKWKGTGTPEDVVFQGTVIEPKSPKGTFCCGFTFTVAMHAAQERHLLDSFTAQQIHELQLEWYGSTPNSKDDLLVGAMKRLGIGTPISMESARPGDFVQFWRFASGHSVIFLDWVRNGDKIIGMHYRSSQSSTKGIGDRTEYFLDNGFVRGTINAKRVYIARLIPSPSDLIPQ